MINKKEIQKNRIKKYFIDSTKEIILEEGLSNVTTKKIGDKAGYSYATIYNYFENFNELLCIAISEMASECAAYVEKNMTGNTSMERILSFASLMIAYNSANPNIYFPFLSTQIDFTYFKNDQSNHFVHPAYSILIKELNTGESFAHLSENEIRILADLLVAIFHAKMHFFITLKSLEDIEELKKEFFEECNFILSRI